MSDITIENPVVISTITSPELLDLPPQQDNMPAMRHDPALPATLSTHTRNSSPQLINRHIRGSLSSMLLEQRDIIRALTHSPSVLANYVHYRGSQDIKFKGATITIPKVPFIPHNDPHICCIVDKMDGINNTDESCSNMIVRPLGPKGKVGVPYIIQDDNGTMIAKLTQVDKLYSSYLVVPPTSLASFIGKNRAVKHCISDIKLSHIRYIASDEFTNETLIAYILNYLILENSKLGKQLPLLFVRHYQSGICEKNTGDVVGLNIMENCDLGPLDNLPDHSGFDAYIQDYIIDDNGREVITSLVNPENILQILTQITVGLHMLQTLVNFTSGDLKAGNIFVKSEPINETYMGISLNAPFTCKIADYGKSSCMLYKPNGTAIRFFNESNLANVYLSIHPFEDEIEVENHEYYYTVSNTFNSQVYTRTRHMGIPFYHSFDYYTVLVSMLTNPAFYYMFFATDTLRRIFWDPIWDQPSDSNESMRRIRGYLLEGKGHSINDAINILRGLKLKCSAVHQVIKQLLILEALRS